MVTYLDEFLLIDSHHPLRPLYLHYHCAYGHQACKDGDIPWQAPNHEVIQSFDNVVLQGHVTNQNHFDYKSAYGNQT